MKFSIFTFIFGILFSVSAYASDIEGVWELVSGEYKNEHGEMVAYDEIGLKSLKIISGSHFSFTSMKGERFWASGSGSYSFSEGRYVEELKFNSFGEKPGARFSFSADLDGEYWRNARWDNGERVEFEVWKRVE